MTISIFIGATFLDLILQESYENVRVVVEKLKLNDLDCCIASEIKLINALLGISSHSEKFSCPYCTSGMTMEGGELGTFGSLEHVSLKQQGQR